LIELLVTPYNSYLSNDDLRRGHVPYFSVTVIVVVVFPQAPFRVTNVPGQASAGIIQLRNCTMAFLRTALGDLVTPFVLESCLIIHVLLNLQVHTWGMSLASSGKFV
jgi:hypothetical protein